MTVCCDTCPYAVSCEELAEFRCGVGLHDWTNRGMGDDLWRECYSCGHQEDR